MIECKTSYEFSTNVSDRLRGKIVRFVSNFVGEEQDSPKLCQELIRAVEDKFDVRLHSNVAHSMITSVVAKTTA